MEFTQLTVEVPAVAGHTMRFSWDEDAAIHVVDAGGEIIVRANCDGLRTLARHLLTLAQDGVPEGAHLHLDDSAGLEPGSLAIVLERDDELGT